MTFTIEPQSVLFKENKRCQKFPKTEKNFKSILVTLMERKLHLMFVIILHASNTLRMSTFRSTHPEVFLGKGVLKICRKYTREHPCRSVISIKLLKQIRHGCSPVNLLHIFRTPFPKNASGRLLLNFVRIFGKLEIYLLKSMT